MLSVHQPAGGPQSRWFIAVRHRREHVRRVRENRVAVIVVNAAEANGCRSGCVAFFHHHRCWKGIHQLYAFPSKRQPFVLCSGRLQDVRVTNALVAVSTECRACPGKQFVLHAPRHAFRIRSDNLRHRRSFRQQSNFVIEQSSIVKPQLINLPLKLVPMDAASDSQHAVLCRAARVAIGVVENVRRCQFAVQPDLLSECPLTPVVGKSHMYPFICLQRLVSLHCADSGDPAGDNVELQMAVSKFDREAGASRT